MYICIIKIKFDGSTCLELQETRGGADVHRMGPAFGLFRLEFLLWVSVWLVYYFLFRLGLIAVKTLWYRQSNKHENIFITLYDFEKCNIRVGWAQLMKTLIVHPTKKTLKVGYSKAGDVTFYIW